MDDLPEADRYLLDRIGRGDADAWAQLVGRYHGRLLAFARGRLTGKAGRAADAEDLVQDTFAAFVRTFRASRWDANIETFLFTILRRRLIDAFRGRGTGGLRVCSIHDAAPGGGADGDGRALVADLSAGVPAASWYARRDEEADRLTAALTAAVKRLADRLKADENLHDLQVVEAVFYAQLRNKDAAEVCGTSEGRVAVVKHRCLKEIRDHVAAALSAAGTAAGASAAPAAPADRVAWDSLDAAASMLTDAWERLRPTCPKRSTLGRYLLGTLGPPWQGYVRFHATALGCRFCEANLADLGRQDEPATRSEGDRLFQSTVGFLTRPPG